MNQLDIMNNKKLEKRYDDLYYQQEGKIDFQEYLKVILYRKWVIIIAFAVIVLATLFYTYRATPVYQAKARILVDSSRSDYYYDQPGILSQGDIFGLNRSRSIETQLEIIKSRPLLEQVMKRMDLPTHNYAVESFRNCISLSSVKNTDVVEVIVRHPDPKKASQIANLVVDVYIDQNLNLSRKTYQSAREFIEQQMSLIKKDLVKSEEDLASYQKKVKVADIDSETKEKIQKLAGLEAEKAKMTADIFAIKASIKETQELLKSQSKMITATVSTVNNPVLTKLQEKLTELEVKRVGLLEEYTSNHPNVKMTKKEIDQTKSEIRRQLSFITGGQTRTVNPIYQTILEKNLSQKAQLVSLEASEKKLAGLINNWKNELANIPDKKLDLVRLERRKQVADRTFQALMNKYQEVRISEAANVAKAQAVEPAIVPFFPISPNKKQNIFVAIFVGLAVGLGLAFLLEYLDDSLKNPDDIRKKLRLVNLGLSYATDQHLLTHPNARSMSAETFSSLSSNITFTSVDSPINILSVTSSLPGEGKTTVTADLAVSMAKEGKEVLVIDGDLRHPCQHKLFGVDNVHGITDVLVEDFPLQHAIQPTKIEKLSILTTGTIPPNPVEIFKSNKMKKLLDTLRNKYDIVIIDCPPLLGITDSVILSTLSDGVLLVIEAEETSQKIIQEALEHLKLANSKILGTVLNKISLKGHSRYGYAYPYNYYNYYHHYYQRPEQPATWKDNIKRLVPFIKQSKDKEQE